jgi:hypothetical protein
MAMMERRFDRDAVGLEVDDLEVDESVVEESEFIADLM